MSLSGQMWREQIHAEPWKKDKIGKMLSQELVTEWIELLSLSGKGSDGVSGIKL